MPACVYARWSIHTVIGENSIYSQCCRMWPYVASSPNVDGGNGRGKIDRVRVKFSNIGTILCIEQCPACRMYIVLPQSRLTASTLALTIRCMDGLKNTSMLARRGCGWRHIQYCRGPATSQIHVTKFAWCRRVPHILTNLSIFDSISLEEA